VGHIITAINKWNKLLLNITRALIRVEVNLNRSKSAERKPFIWHNTKWEDV